MPPQIVEISPESEFADWLEIDHSRFVQLVIFGSPGSCVDHHVPLKPDAEPDDVDDDEEEEDDEDDEELDEPELAPPDELPPVRLSARSDGDVGSRDVLLFVNWHPAANTVAMSTTGKVF